MNAPAWIAFLAAAAVGAPARYLVDGFVQERTAGAFPWGTFTVNVVGSLVLGLLTGAALYHHLPAVDRTVLGTGFCGAFTTYSTFSFETIRLAEEGARAEAVRNAVASVAVTLVAAAAGLAIAWAW